MLHVKPFTIPYGLTTLSSPELKFDNGTIVQIYGASGSGADDICLYLAGMLSRLRRTDPAPSGRILRQERKVQPLGVELNGTDLSQLTDQQRAQEVGVIFGDPSRYFIGDTVLEEFRVAIAAAGLEYDVGHERRLEKYGLFGLLKRQTEVLSGGETHRLNLACVLELRPKLLVADLSRCNLDTEFICELKNRLVAERYERITVVYGLPPGSFKKDVVELVVDAGKVAFSCPDPRRFPSVGDELGALTARVGRSSPGQMVLNVNGLCRRQITRPVSFSLHEGEIIHLRGHNGIGKTTLGEILAGRVRPAEIDGGTLPPLSQFSPFMSLQDSERFFFWNDKVKDLIPEDIAVLCGFTQDDDTRIKELPFSRQKLVSVALVLSLSRGFAVLDEPTAGMDFVDKLRVADLLDHYATLPVIMFSHDEAMKQIGTVTRFEDVMAS
jgi:energy-coupling factor transport system ATP-binding protein